MGQTDVMVVGVGGIGGWCVEFLTREPSISTLVAADIRADYGRQKLNTAVSGANQMGYYPETEFVQMDLLADVSKNAEIIAKVNPRCILNCSTMLTWWAPSALLAEALKPLTDVSALGPWVALHLRLLYHLMLAVKASGLKPYVVNGAYGDATSPALKTQGLETTVGMGNLDNMGILVRKQVAEKEGVKPRDVLVYLVAHHFNNVWFSKEGPGPRPPYFIKIFVGEQDVTEKYDTFELLRNTAAGRMRLGGSGCDSQVASSQCKHALALLNDSKILSLAPAPGGLPGGYPVRIGADGAKVALPDGITMDEALKINLEGQKRDGIEEIKDDGTIVFPDPVYEAAKKIYNFDCKSFNIKDVDTVSTEQFTKFKELLSKYQRELPYTI
jgi:hypothetical protein